VAVLHPVANFVGSAKLAIVVAAVAVAAAVAAVASNWKPCWQLRMRLKLLTAAVSILSSDRQSFATFGAHTTAAVAAAAAVVVAAVALAALVVAALAALGVACKFAADLPHRPLEAEAEEVRVASERVVSYQTSRIETEECWTACCSLHPSCLEEYFDEQTEAVVGLVCWPASFRTTCQLHLLRRRNLIRG